MVLQGKVGDGITYFNVKNKKAASKWCLVETMVDFEWCLFLDQTNNKSRHENSGTNKHGSTGASKIINYFIQLAAVCFIVLYMLFKVFSYVPVTQCGTSDI